MTDLIFWYDLVTTGYNLPNDEILEIAVVLTDTKLNYVGEFQRLVNPGTSLVNWLSERDSLKYKTMADALSKEKTNDRNYVERELLEWLERYSTDEILTCGGGGIIYFGKQFMKEKMPKAYLTIPYRYGYDVTVLQEYARTRFGKKVIHSAQPIRAMDTVIWAITIAKELERRIMWNTASNLA